MWCGLLFTIISHNQVWLRLRKKNLCCISLFMQVPLIFNLFRTQGIPYIHRLLCRVCWTKLAKIWLGFIYFGPKKCLKPRMIFQKTFSSTPCFLIYLFEATVDVKTISWRSEPFGRSTILGFALCYFELKLNTGRLLIAQFWMISGTYWPGFQIPRAAAKCPEGKAYV